FSPPLDRMVQTAVCGQSGHLARPDCPTPDTLYIPAQGHRSAVCPYHRIIHTNRAGTFQVTADCAAPDDIVAAKWLILPPAMQYYYKQRYRSEERRVGKEWRSTWSYDY